MTILPEKSKDICSKCTYFKTCKKPCYPVSRYLYEPGDPYEKKDVVYPLHKHVQHSACLKPSDDGKESDDNILSSELESPFKSFSPKMKTTGVFIHRFFLRENYKDIAQMFGVSESGARVLYSNAVQKILENLELLDRDGRKEIAHNHYKKMYRKKRNNIPKNLQWYVMANVFGLTPKEIAEIDGNTTNRNVSSAICRVADRVKAGIEVIL